MSTAVSPPPAWPRATFNRQVTAVRRTIELWWMILSMLVGKCALQVSCAFILWVGWAGGAHGLGARAACALASSSGWCPCLWGARVPGAGVGAEATHCRRGTRCAHRGKMTVLLETLETHTHDKNHEVYTKS